MYLDKSYVKINDKKRQGELNAYCIWPVSFLSSIIPVNQESQQNKRKYRVDEKKKHPAICLYSICYSSFLKDVFVLLLPFDI
jgi:hypothetical protein